MIEDRQPVAIHLYGPLADKYGPLHHFAIGSPHEAVRALDANYPGFIRDFAASQVYHVLVDGDWREGDAAAASPVSRELHLVPQVEGNAAAIGLLVGALFPALGATTILGVSAATLIGGALFYGVLIGLSFLFRPKPMEQEDQDRNEGFAFTGPENVVTQGAAVPLAYGRVHCGSVVVSAGLEVAELSAWLDDPKGQSMLQSRQYARIIDAISDGEILGFGGSDIFLDGVPLPNFANTQVQLVLGQRDQPYMLGFPSQQTEIGVGLELEYGESLIRAITNLDADRVRITLSTPSLQEIDKESGDVRGTNVEYQFDIDHAGTGFVPQLAHYMSGKTSSRYQRSYLFDLPQPGPWNIRVWRTSPKSTKVNIQHDLYFDSYTEIVDDRVNYNGTACVGLFLDSEQFSTIPKRTYLAYGILCLVPSNYASGYSGVWDGTFVRAWTDNPAWILYDILVNHRHGIGSFLSADQVDKWALYSIGQWCDQYVPDGRGGYERRFTCNVQITSRQEAFDLIGQIASIFRGFTYWSGTQMVAVADQPSDFVHQFTNASVIDGSFNYSGSDLRARHTMASVAWNDPAQLGQPRLAVVEDPAAISRYGIQELEMQAIGCTSEAQAIRTGRWALYTELYEGEAITFSTGLDSAFARPGEIIQVADVNIAGNRMGGRIAAFSTASVVNIDAPTFIAVAPFGIFLSCIIGEGVIETRQVASFNSPTQAVMLAPYSQAPQPDTVFVMSALDSLEPTLWRVISVRQAEVDRYEINAVRHYPGKWAYIENNIPLDLPDISDIQLAWPPVTGMTVREYLIQTSAISVGVRVVLSWISLAPSFEVSYRPLNGNWTTTRTDAAAIDLPVTEGFHQFYVRAVSLLGIKGEGAYLGYTVIGRFAPPDAPRQFRVNKLDSVAHFDWLPAPEIDVIIGGHFELRHSSRTTGATWNASQVVIPSIPGSASSVATGYKIGTWFLRTFDIAGVPSAESAAIIALAADSSYQRYARICESPDWLGSRYNTEVLEPQRWLVIGETGGLWDRQTDLMNDWLTVDVLPDMGEPAEPYGSYEFYNRIDAGAPFDVRLSADILAFPFADPDDFIDSRMILVDTWQDWDDVDVELDGQVTLLVRSTLDDPDNPATAWSDWQTFIAGEHYARAWDFQAALTAPLGQNIGVEEICIIADLRNKIDEGADVPYAAATTRVTFLVKFYSIPAVVITVQEAASTDNIKIIAKTREYFDIEIKNNSGVHQARTFDWHAQGF